MHALVAGRWCWLLVTEAVLPKQEQPAVCLHTWTYGTVCVFYTTVHIAQLCT